MVQDMHAQAKCNFSSLSFNLQWNRNTVLFISTIEILKVCDRWHLGKTITVANEEGKHNLGAIIWLFYCICVIWVHFSGQKLEMFEGLMCVISEYQSIGWKNFSPYNLCVCVCVCVCASSEHLDYGLIICLWLRGNCTPDQKLACFVHYLKIINTSLKNNICIL